MQYSNTRRQPAPQPVTQPPAPIALTVQQALAGKGIPFELDGRRFLIRQPAPEEYDDAIWQYRVVRRLALAAAQGMGLAALSVPLPEVQTVIDSLQSAIDASPDEDEQKALKDRLAAFRKLARNMTMAEVSANERANDAQMRRLVSLLLCYEDGQPVIPEPDTPDGERAFALLPLPLLRAAKTAVQEMLDAIERLPFEWVTGSESTPDLLSDIIYPPTTTAD